MQTVCHQFTETDFQIQFVQIFKKTAVYGIGELVHIIGQIFADRCSRYLIQTVRKIICAVNTIGVLQMLHKHLRIFLLELPEIYFTASLQRVRIRNVKYIFQSRKICRIVNQRNSFCTTIDPSTHFVVPKLQRSTSRCIRTLCVNQELFVKGIAIQSGCCIKIPHPMHRRSGNIFCRPFRQCTD